MPLPKPKKDESKDDFLDRCMASDAMNEEYPDNKQRYAVCVTQWESKETDAMPNEMERRVLSADDVELRVVNEDGKRKITGYAAVFGKQSVDLGGFIEVIEPGAFARALDEKHDVRCLKNHDPNLVLGRTKSGTLTLEQNGKGLKFTVKPGDTQTARDTAEEIARGDIDGCSFAFRTLVDEWDYDQDPPLRTLKDMELFDVGPVTYPAYPDTSVAMRSLAAVQKRVEPSGEAPVEKPAEPEPVYVDAATQARLNRRFDRLSKKLTPKHEG
jgi:HK97 family phage prohead protease